MDWDHRADGLSRSISQHAARTPTLARQVQKLLTHPSFKLAFETGLKAAHILRAARGTDTAGMRSL
jgi:hypothetical protein